MSDRFEPSLFSLEVNQFIIDHAGEPPELALQHGLPGTLKQEPNPNPTIAFQQGTRDIGTSRADVFPIIDKLYRLHQQELHQGLKWCGLDAIKTASRTYLEQKSKWEAAHKRGAPAEPSRFAWDGLGRGHLQGVGSDSSYVKTYFDKAGNRHDLGVDFYPSGSTDYVPEWIADKGNVVLKPDYTDLLDDETNGIISCPICKFSQTYMLGSQSRKNMARARVGRHLMTAKKDPELHRQLHSYIFGGADATKRD